MALSKWDIADRWKEGRAGNSDKVRWGEGIGTIRIKTDGSNLYSYRLQIGWTEDSRKIGANFTGARHHRSKTTESHVDAAAAVADEMREPTRAGKCAFDPHTQDFIGRATVGLDLTDGMKDALRMIAHVNVDPELRIHGGVGKALALRMLAVRDGKRTIASVQGVATAIDIFGPDHRCPGCLGWEMGVECPLHPMGSSGKAFYDSLWKKYQCSIVSLPPPGTSSS